MTNPEINTDSGLPAGRRKAKTGSLPPRRGRPPKAADSGSSQSTAASAPAVTPPVPASVTPPVAKASPGGKLGIVVGLLRRRQGATVAQLSEATDWPPHSVRGAMAGALKKKHKLTITSEPAEGGRVYRLAEAG